jgi:hypothetical protein
MAEAVVLVGVAVVVHTELTAMVALAVLAASLFTTNS